MNVDYSEFFKVFAQVSKAIHSGENTTEILEHIVKNIRALLGAKGCIFWIVDHGRRKIETMVSDGFPYRNLADVNYQELTKIFNPDGGPFIFIADARTDHRIPEIDTIGKKTVGSISGMPLDIIGNHSGILAVYFYAYRELSERDREIITALGEQGAIALHKALSYDEKMLQNLRQVVEVLALAIEAKDESTHGHSVRVARFAKMIAQQIGLPESEVETIHHGGLLHDIGKIGMNDDILERLGILSRREMDIVKQHPVIGAKIVSPLRFLDDVVPLIRHHHERYDGSGYPDGLKGEAIPLGARILTVCDAFETMLAGRTHFARMKLEDAVVNLQQGAGHQFDQAVVAALFAALEANPEQLPERLSGSELACLKRYQEKLATSQPRAAQLFI
ncbi:MAG: HD domain-containing protein [Desulfofustis sp.]|nr:HD domain-containing protein [Desulfofustis sp.]